MSTLKHVQGRIVVEVDTEKKNSHTFQDGTVIRLERKYNEFNRRITEPTNATVISAENIPAGCEILVGHNALHEVNKINNYTSLSGGEAASSVKYYSLPESDCYAWRDENGELQPMKDFCFALRVFRPYEGFLVGIEPKVIPNVLYITTGELKGKICHTLVSSDYEIIYQGDNGREGRVIRVRHSDDECIEREEITCIDHCLTEKYFNGGLLIGLNYSDAKKNELCQI